MYKIKVLGKKVKMTTIKSMAVITVCLAFSFPFIHKVVPDGKGYYNVELNGQVIGAAATEEDIQTALKNARQRVVKEAGSLVYMMPELDVAEKDKWFGKRLNQEELEEIMYSILKESAVLPKQESYTVRVNDTTVYLSSKEEVLDLLNATKNRFDVENEFDILLVEDNDSPFSLLTTNIVKPGVEAKAAETVYAAQGGEEAPAQEPELEDGIVSVEFEQNVEVVASYVAPDQLSTVEDAYNLLTKENEQSQIYEVVPGDCMSIIAENHSMSTTKLYELNGSINEDTILQIGDKIVVSVPEPELSVLVTEEQTYQEDYQEDIIYIDNAEWYTTKQVVQQEGTIGQREVVALVSTRNGREIDREVIKETILTESLPRIIERGTMSPPTYIKPIVGGTLTSYYGQRWGRLHAGIDMGCPTGTTVMASSGGQVVSAGWNGGYGYSILLRHPDGTQTRYAHLSKILVSTGQYVSQGEKIALSGNTGNSTGPHLHFEILINGTSVNPLNYIR